MKKLKKTFLGAVVLSSALFTLGAQTSSSSAVELYKKAYNLQQKEDFFAAVEAYQEALLINPQYADAWYNLALCTFNLGEYDLAVEYADKAAKYSKNLSDIQNLKGFSLLSLGKTEDAKSVFTNVLKNYPNNVDARFGLAELDLYNGSLRSAERRYLDALKRDSKSRKALLSLALVTAEEGKTDVAERYVNQALEYHSGEAEVHYLASYLALKRGNITEAERRARSAVQIKSDYDKAYELLAEILYGEGRYTEVIDICEFRIGRNRMLPSAWYLKALSLEQMGETESALDTFTTGLSIDSSDEIMRFALEQLVSTSLPIEDSRRNQWAAYHVEKALGYNKNFDGPSERYEYQKALSVDPLNSNARQSFANLLERDGFYELYLQQLQFIKDNTEKSPEIASIQTDENSPKPKLSEQEIKNNDTIEALQSLMSDNLSAKWNVNPFYLDKTRWNIGLYYTASPVQLLHPDAEKIVVKAAGDIFNGVPSAAVDVKEAAVSGFGEAYRLARTEGRDYFAILSMDETERSFSLNATIYSARTGTKTTEFHVYRTGNDRVAKTLRRFRQAILDILPIRGTVLKNSAGTLLVDLGKSDGISSGAEFDVVKKGKILTADTGSGVYYNSKDILGTYIADVVDEELSQGDFKKKGFYDILNAGDEVVLLRIPNDSESVDGNIVTDTRPAADGNGEPATEAASRAERDGLKEDLAGSAQESTLLKMIRDIL